VRESRRQQDQAGVGEKERWCGDANRGASPSATRKFYNLKFCVVAGSPLNFFLENWYLVLAAAVSGGLLLWPSLGRGLGGARISPAQAVQLINRERAVIIDVSEPAEFALGHAGGARNVPLGQLQASGDLPKNKTLPVLLFCATGARAARAAAVLTQAGYGQVHVVAGGIAGWREANMPVEKSATAISSIGV